MKLTKEKLAKLIKEELENEGYKPKGKAYKKYDDDEDYMEESHCNSDDKAHKKDDKNKYMEEAELINEEEPGAVDIDAIMASFAENRGPGRWVIELTGAPADMRFWQKNVRKGAEGVVPQWGPKNTAKMFYNDDEGKMKALSSWFKLRDHTDAHNLAFDAEKLQNESTKITISQLSKLIAEQVANPMGDNPLDPEELLTTIANLEELLTTIAKKAGESGDAKDKLDQIGMMINLYFGS